ncbi:MAG: phage protease [Smithella sp.]|jgi:phage I-like protein
MDNLFVLSCKDLNGIVPKEIQVIPYGIKVNTPKGPFTCDEESAAAIIADFEAHKNQMVIDYEHQTLQGTEAPAAGWITQLIDKGKDGIWAVVNWTEKAKQYLINKEYKYVSPVVAQRKLDSKIVRLINVALTNQPNIDGMVPLVNKAGLDAAHSAQQERSSKYGIGIKDGGNITKPGQWSNVPDEEFLDPVNYRYPCPDADHTRSAASYWGKAKDQEQYSTEERAKITARLDKMEEKFKIGKYQKEATHMNKLKVMLKLAADATEEQIADAVQVLVNKLKDTVQIVANKSVLTALELAETATEAEVTGTIMAMKQSHAQVGTLAQELADIKKTLSAKDAAEVVALAMKEGKITPAQKEWADKYAESDLEGFKVFVAKAPVVVVMGRVITGEAPAEGALDESQTAVNKMMGVDLETFKKFDK